MAKYLGFIKNKPLKRPKRNRPRTYVIGDLHGAYKALCEVLQKVNFNYERDTLIFIGDLADGWGDFDKCLKKFLTIKNFYPIIGNHDLYLMDFLKTGIPKDEWLSRGGISTLKTIESNPNAINMLTEYFLSAKYYHILEDKFFCHGGFNHKRAITNQKRLTFAINRQMYKTAQKYDRQKIKFDIKYDESNSIKLNEIFIGHSTTRKFKPAFKANLINVDTGAGSVGYLTIMDVYRKSYIQSQKVEKLYKSK